MFNCQHILPPIKLTYCPVMFEYFSLIHKGLLWSCSYGSWNGITITYAISAYHHWHCVLDTILCDKTCQWLPKGRWFSPSTTISSNNKTDRHDIIEILLKIAVNTKNPLTSPYTTARDNCSNVSMSSQCILPISCVPVAFNITIVLWLCKQIISVHHGIFND